MRSDRRGRAIAFAVAAALCAGLAASAAGGGRSDLAAELGELRAVVVARHPLPPGRPLGRIDAARALEVRRVPVRFLPPGALATPAQAVGRAPAVPIPAGGYVLGSQLEAPGAERAAHRRLDAGRRPIEIAVMAAGTLASRPRRGRRVDVVVTTEPGAGGGAGRTYVAAEAVQLLDLRSTGEHDAPDVVAAGPADRWIATLALARGEALRLIQAESFARAVRLIPR